MQATKIIKTGIKIAVVIITLLAGFQSAHSNVAASSPETTTNLLDGITLDSSLSPEDVTYLATTLQLLRDQLPEWAQYVQDSKPFTLIVDTREGDKGREAIANCCDTQGRGTITLGHHLGYSVDANTPEAQQAMFIGTLIHELAHVRDQRAGRASKTSFKSCVTAEKSGLDKQLDVKRAMATLNLGYGYRQALDQQITSEAKALQSRELWDFYCGAFDK